MNLKILVIGASGMLGSSVYRFLSHSSNYCVFGSIRNESKIDLFNHDIQANLIANVDVLSDDSLFNLFNQVHPKVVINCVGLVKQITASEDPLSAIPINSLLPHKLANLSRYFGARFVQISTDCVFSGAQGLYKESDIPDAFDIYGRSKLLGEVNYPHAITLRTSIIGHELESNRSLVNWFLSQRDHVQGYSKAIFSGLPTVELAQIILNNVIPHSNLHGLYHVSADPINKYELLKLIAKEYGKNIEIECNSTFTIDRSLDSTPFRVATGYQPLSWVELVKKMREFG